MNKHLCPSCGKEIVHEGTTCEHCGSTLFHEGISPSFEEISPYDDLFSDDIVPPKRTQKIPEETVTRERKNPAGFNIPVRQLAFVIVVVCIFIIVVAGFMLIQGSMGKGTAPANHSEISNQQDITLNNTREPVAQVKPANKSVPVQEKSINSLSDDFSDSSSGWGSYSGDTFLKYYSQGEYHMIQKGEDMSDRALLGKDYGDFSTEVETRLDSGPLTGLYGLVFRNNGSDYYSLDINGRGWFSVKKHQNGKVYEIIPLTETYILNKGYAKNKLGVRADGDTLSIYINGKMVRAVKDTALSHGDIGFFVSRLSEKGYIGEQAVHAVFDNFKIEPLQNDLKRTYLEMYHSIN